ncbi:hypothetical protein ABIE37_002655 [Arthrobacter bambusae]|uniref:Uncharacterized protein n=1 Tax=Arthrobacter bambusae TaxID=1338426 RepID=A0ABV2P8J3_9MICC
MIPAALDIARNDAHISLAALHDVWTRHSGGQITEELHTARREVKWAVSIIPGAPAGAEAPDLNYKILKTHNAARAIVDTSQFTSWKSKWIQ